MRDSSRFRNRLYHVQLSIDGQATYLSSELGIYVPPATRGRISSGFFEDAEMRDVLDYISLSVRLAKSKHMLPQSIERFIGDVQRIMDEENIAFSLDDEGMIHPRIDPAFSQAQSAAVSALEGRRYENVREQFTASERALNTDSPDFKQAIRSIFAANEGLFRLIAPRAARLGAKELRDHLTPILDTLYSADATAKRSAFKLLDSFAQWVESAHNYRHEPGQEEPVQPPDHLAVTILSEGVSMLRWLAKIDQRHP